MATAPPLAVTKFLTTATPTLSYSLVEGGVNGSGIAGDPNTDDGNNLDADPQFVDASAPAGAAGVFVTPDDGLALQAGSPAIDSGNNSSIPSGVTTDLTGAQRLLGAAVDMGMSTRYRAHHRQRGLAHGDGLSYNTLLDQLWLQGVSGGDADTLGFNLVGNSYWVTVDWDAALGWTKTNLNASFCVWDNASGSYLSWNGATGTLLDGKIAPFQGFWVQATGGVFYGAAGSGGKEQQPVPQIKFGLKEGGDHLQGGLHLRSKAVGRDRLDALKLASLNARYLSLYTTGSDGDALDINALPSFSDSTEASAGEVDMDFDGSNLGGKYTLNWTPQDIPEGWSATLTDAHTGKQLDLSHAGDYTFSVTKPSKGSGGKAGSGSPMLQSFSDGAVGQIDTNDGPVSETSEVSETSKLNQPTDGALPTVVKGKVANPRFTLSFSPAKAPDPQQAPLGGLEILAVIGGGYAIKKLRDCNKH